MLQRLFFTFTFFLFLVCPVVSHASQTSDKELAITVIDALVQSLKEHPNQFSLTINSIGVKASANGGGTGIYINAQGGGPGSQTTGLNASASTSTGNIETVQTEVNQEMTKKAEEATTTLKEMKNILQQKQVDKPSLLSSLKKFSATYVPPAIKVVIESLIKKLFKL